MDTGAWCRGTRKSGEDKSMAGRKQSPKNGYYFTHTSAIDKKSSNGDP